MIVGREGRGVPGLWGALQCIFTATGRAEIFTATGRAETAAPDMRQQRICCSLNAEKLMHWQNNGLAQWSRVEKSKKQRRSAD